MSKEPAFGSGLVDDSKPFPTILSEANPPTTAVPILHDVIIIGAGPCGLAVAARLCEHTPSAIFTDEEHQRYHWIRKHGRKMSIMKGKGGCVVLARSDESVRGEKKPASRPADCTSLRSSHPRRDRTESKDSESSDDCAIPELGHKYKALVLDATADQWMASWNRLFELFDITHLRSPMFFHVDPRDRDGLLAYTYERGRKDELKEIRDCVGKEVSKHKKKKKQAERMSKETGSGPKAKLEIDERDRKDYYTPSRSLFSSHCDCIVNRYGLNEGLIRKESVQDLDFGLVLSVSQTDEVFTITTNKQVHYARSVVAAVGAGNQPSIPDSLNTASPEEGLCHSNQIKQFPPLNIGRKIKLGKRTDVLVVGGGLTSAQLDDLLIRRGVTKVWHLMRGDLKVKPFDVNLEWMGKFKNHEKAIFWSADNDQDRLEQIRTARNGGSITPTYHKILKSHITAERISLHTRTTLTSRLYNADSQSWNITTDPLIPDLPRMDYIYFATGTAPDFSTVPFLQTMLRRFPLHGHGGFPCLSEDLMWRGNIDGVRSTVARDERSKVDGRLKAREDTTTAADDDDDDENIAAADPNTDLGKRVPLFVTGRLASLRLGPGAGNLEGARVGAERIAWALQEVLADCRSDGLTSRRSEDAADKTGDRPGSGADDVGSGEEENEDRMYRYCAGIGSRYESLDTAANDE